MDLRLRTGPDEWIPISIQAVPDIDRMAINRVERGAGEWPPGRPRNCRGDQQAGRYARHAGRIDGGNQAALRHVRSCAWSAWCTTSQSGAASGGGGYFFAPMQGYITTDTLEWLEHTAHAQPALSSPSAENPNDLKPISARWPTGSAKNSIERLYARSTLRMRRLATIIPTSPTSTRSPGVLILLGFLVVFLSAFLITNTLSALLNQQIQQIGHHEDGRRRARCRSIVIYMVLILVYSAAGAGSSPCRCRMMAASA